MNTQVRNHIGITQTCTWKAAEFVNIFARLKRGNYIFLCPIAYAVLHMHTERCMQDLQSFFFYIVLDLSLDQTQLLIDLVPDTHSLHSCHSQITQASSIEWILQLHLCRDMGCGRCNKGKEAHQNLYSSPGLIQIFLCAWGERKREKKKKKSQQKKSQQLWIYWLSLKNLWSSEFHLHGAG